MAYFARFQPCGGCCCTIITDNFQREQVGDADWQVVSGTWSIQKAEIGSARWLEGCGIGIRIYHKREIDERLIKVSVVIGPTPYKGQVYQLYFGYDADTHTGYRLELAVDTNTAKLFDPAGVQIGPTLYVQLNPYYPPYTKIACVCLWQEEGDDRLVIVGGLDGTGQQTTFGSIPETALPGKRVALGGSESGECLVFDDLLVQHSEHHDCPDCPRVCPHCFRDARPSCMKVTIGGMANGTCTDCACLNKTYYLAWVAGCGWEVSMFTGEYCIGTYQGYGVKLRCEVLYEDETYKLRVRFVGVSGTVVLFEWIKALAGKPDCMTLDEQDIPNTVANALCAAANSVVRVQAVDGNPCPNLTPTCAACQNCGLPMPAALQVTIAGVQNTPYCNQCAQINGTYILAPVAGQPACSYRYTLPTPLCSGNIAYLSASFSRAGGNYYLTVESGPKVLELSFQKTHPAPINCVGLANENVPVKPHAVYLCDQTLATCLVSAL